MTFNPLPHQITDAAFLASRQIAGCFNGMGTGKTRTALMAAAQVEAKRIVIVGPPISLSMWAAEATDHLGLEAQILKTGKTPIGTARVVVCSYEIATKRALELAGWGTDGVLICDESHALKSTKAKRTKAILGRGGMVNAFAHAWFLTGSPMTRWADDLIPFLFRAAPDQIKGKIGALNIDRYNLRYCIVQKRQFPGARFPTKMTVGSRNLEELGQILSTCATRRTLDDVWKDMPSLTQTRLEVSPKGIGQLVRDINKMTMAEVEEGLRSNDGNLSSMRREIGLSMIPEAADYIAEQLEAGSGPILVGAWHRDVIDGLQQELQGERNLRVGSIDGRTGNVDKNKIAAAWNDKQLDVLVGQIGAMGVSLNLQQGGHRIVVVEEDWSPSIMDQFYARLHRMGQTRPVHVDTLFVDTKISKAVHAISSAKRRAHAATHDAHQQAAMEG
jgi:SWI/SNF-related matrix-associated actin-dependent regulator 1 of chromatin subfamily A